MTDKALTRLAELLPTYKDKLQDKDVYSNFVGLVNRAKQFASQEMAQAVDEWKSQLEKVKEPEIPRCQTEQSMPQVLADNGRRSACRIFIRVNVSKEAHLYHFLVRFNPRLVIYAWYQ